MQESSAWEQKRGSLSREKRKVDWRMDGWRSGPEDLFKMRHRSQCAETHTGKATNSTAHRTSKCVFLLTYLCLIFKRSSQSKPLIKTELIVFLSFHFTIKKPEVTVFLTWSCQLKDRHYWLCSDTVSRVLSEENVLNPHFAHPVKWFTKWNQRVQCERLLSTRWDIKNLIYDIALLFKKVMTKIPLGVSLLLVMLQ